jgi:hypothetical protein
MTRLSFTARWHQYAIDGKRVPNVSTIAKFASGSTDGLTNAAANEAAMWALQNRDALDLLGEGEWLKAAARAHRTLWDTRRDDGTMLHSLAEAIVYGRMMPAEVDGKPVPEHVADMAEQFAGFLDSWRVHPVEHETMIWHDRYRYAGRFDLLADFDGQRWLLDIKTGASGVWPDAALQLTGYRYATHWVDADNVDRPVADLGIERTAVVWIRPDTWEVIPTRSDPHDFAAFVHCGGVAEWAAAAKAKGSDLIGEPLPRPESVAS